MRDTVGHRLGPKLRQLDAERRAERAEHSRSSVVEACRPREHARDSVFRCRPPLRPAVLGDVSDGQEDHGRITHLVLHQPLGGDSDQAPATPGKSRSSSKTSPALRPARVSATRRRKAGKSPPAPHAGGGLRSLPAVPQTAGRRSGSPALPEGSHRAPEGSRDSYLRRPTVSDKRSA